MSQIFPNHDQQTLELLDRIDPNRDKAKILKPSFIMEITGTVGSGKSSHRNDLVQYFRRMNWRVSKPEEGASRQEEHRLLPDYNLLTVTYALHKMFETVCSPNSFHLTILERLIFDWIIRGRLLVEDGHFSRESAECLEKALLLPEIFRRCHGVFFIVCTPEETLRRRAISKEKPGKTTNLETLTKLYRIHREVFDEYAGKLSTPFYWLDTTGEGMPESQERIREAFLDCMHKVLAVPNGF